MFIIIYFGILMLFIVYQSVSSYLYFKDKKEIHLEEKDKINMYFSTIIVNIISCSIPLVINLTKELSLDKIGIKKIEINNNAGINKFIIILSYIGIAYIVVLSLVTIAKFYYYRKSNRLLNQAKIGVSEKMIQPITKNEKKIWNFVSLNAAIIEEIVYRGVLIYIIGSFLPDVSLLGIIIIANIIFGMGHAYQGIKGIFKTGGVGFLFSILYVTTGSLVLPMILHFIIDFSFAFTSNKNEITNEI